MAKNKINGHRAKTPGKPIPVTLLSGFLGSGKTTLLQHILSSNHGLRIAVVVNDIGEINVDASLIQQTHSLTKGGDKVVALQNGCICCNLRGDLLGELLRISQLSKFDYIMIESSGISEPEQVAETFDDRLIDEFHETALATGEELDPALKKAIETLKKAGGMERFAKLDTTVTVIDAKTMLDDFDTIEELSKRRNDVTPEDERTVSDLMVDQIEFADVIILNKIDMVNKATKSKIRELITRLNHRAKVIEATYGKVDPKELVNTKLFNMAQAQQGQGWLEDLRSLSARQVNGRNVLTPKPETEEYNVRNFVYLRHRPFHPRRLWVLIYNRFITRFPDEVGEFEDEEDEENEDDEDDEEEEGDDASMSSVESLRAPDPDVILENKRQHPIFKTLLRSKGTFWLATRPDTAGVWSQAGVMLTTHSDMPFFCTMDPKLYTTEDGEVNEVLKNDIECGGEWGDRRQEIVFIGISLDHAALEALLDECLLNDQEWEIWQSIMRYDDAPVERKKQALLELFIDGWPGWNESPLEDDDHDHDHSGHDHNDHDHEDEKKPRSIKAHAKELEKV